MEAKEAFVYGFSYGVTIVIISFVPKSEVWKGTESFFSECI